MHVLSYFGAEMVHLFNTWTKSRLVDLRYMLKVDVENLSIKLTLEVGAILALYSFVLSRASKLVHERVVAHSY